MWPNNINFDNNQNWALLAQQWAAQQQFISSSMVSPDFINFQQQFPPYFPNPNMMDTCLMSPFNILNETKPNWRESHQNRFLPRQPLRPYFPENSNNEPDFRNIEMMPTNFTQVSTNPIISNTTFFNNVMLPFAPNIEAQNNSAKKKTLPPWLRDAIEKMEKDKIKNEPLNLLSQDEDLQDIDDTFAPLTKTISPYDEKFSEEQDLDEIVEPKASAISLNQNSIDMVTKIKLLLTEILMLSTEELISLVVNDKMHMISQQIEDKNHQKTQKAMRKISALGIGEYGSGEDDSDEEGEEPTKDTISKLTMKEKSVEPLTYDLGIVYKTPDKANVTTSTSINVSIEIPRSSSIGNHEGNNSKLSLEERDKIRYLPNPQKYENVLPTLDLDSIVLPTDKASLTNKSTHVKMIKPPKPVTKDDKVKKASVVDDKKRCSKIKDEKVKLNVSSKDALKSSLISEVKKTVEKKTTSSKNHKSERTKNDVSIKLDSNHKDKHSYASNHKNHHSHHRHHHRHNESSHNTLSTNSKKEVLNKKHHIESTRKHENMKPEKKDRVEKEKVLDDIAHTKIKDGSKTVNEKDRKVKSTKEEQVKPDNSNKRKLEDCLDKNVKCKRDRMTSPKKKSSKEDVKKSKKHKKKNRKSSSSTSDTS